jgi:hypothetical protein
MLDLIVRNRYAGETGDAPDGGVIDGHCSS